MTTIGFALITIAVIAVTSVLFIFWIFQAIARGFLGIFRPRRKPVGSLTSQGWQFVLDQTGRTCHRPECRQANPGVARFCRRCGAPLAGEAMSKRAENRNRRSARAWA